MPTLSRRELLSAGLAGGAYALFGGAVPALRAAAGRQRLNVLFIAVDDLRPQITCYGVPGMHTPNVDALAASGTLFNRAYCQQAVCSPSRTSLLCGRRPDTTRVYDLETHFRTTIPDVVTLPQHFKANGYHAQGFSKIYHGGLDDAQSWSVPWWGPNRRPAPRANAAVPADEDDLIPDARLMTMGARNPARRQAPRGPAWSAPDVPDNALGDGMTADHAIEVLREVKDRPFFLATGFLKPHLPFIAPKRYYDLYDPAEIRLPDNPNAPNDCPPVALGNWGELRNYEGMPKQGPVSDQQARELIHGYYAATSYTDAQIGRVLGELDRLGLRGSTVVVLWGDHGWQLGEHGMWCKHTNFELATRSPLLIRVPGQRRAGAKTDALVEFVDIYPTLCDACGLALPEGLEGSSFRPVVEDPSRPWKKAAFSQYPRGNGVMGYSMRTDRYRYTEWQPRDRTQTPVGVELYDHQVDPAENVNVAGLPANKALAAQLSGQLRAGWRGALPG